MDRFSSENVHTSSSFLHCCYPQEQPRDPSSISPYNKITPKKRDVMQSFGLCKVTFWTCMAPNPQNLRSSRYACHILGLRTSITDTYSPRSAMLHKLRLPSSGPDLISQPQSFVPSIFIETVFASQQSRPHSLTHPPNSLVFNSTPSIPSN